MSQAEGIDYERFPRITHRELHGTKAIHHYATITCGQCGTTAKLLDHTSRGMNPIALAKRFSRGGWSVGPIPKKDRCPDCQSKPAKEIAPMATIKADPIPAPPASAEPPREPTREDRRTVIDAIDTRWNLETGRYSASWSDATIADLLKVPRKWVADMRSTLYGDVDTNDEAASKVRADRLAITTAIEKARLAYDKALAAASDAEAVLNDLKKLQERVGW